MTITLFLYGTLKSGRWTTAREANGEQAAGLAEGRHCRRQGATFHDRLCRHAIDIRPATTIGRLYDLPAGFPALEIPEETVLAVGTGDPLADAETQAEFAVRELVIPEATDGWDTVHGELITFADPARDLPPLDRLEGFRPDGHGLYRRALVATRANTGVEAAWVYHMARVRQGQRLRGGVWPSVAP
jgi:gamma-glutamylcyclotransferase (GGCT)/AIG2-like uncharacterized protein YtfP